MTPTSPLRDKLWVISHTFLFWKIFVALTHILEFWSQIIYYMGYNYTVINRAVKYNNEHAKKSPTGWTNPFSFCGLLTMWVCWCFSAIAEMSDTSWFMSTLLKENGSKVAAGTLML